MIPTVSTLSILPPVTLVNTSVPGSIALRVPIDSVAPSVSSAVIDNNARGSSTPLATPAQSEASAALSPDVFSSLPSNNSVDGIASAQTNFFAQLIGQGSGQDAHSLLVVYERLVENAQVRYKPSNADLPAPEPAGVYGRILQQEKEEVHTSQQIILPQPRTTAADAPIVVALPVIKSTRDDKTVSAVPTDATAQEAAIPAETVPAPATPLPAPHSYEATANAAPLPTKATSAYVATQARPAQSRASTLESA